MFIHKPKSKQLSPNNLLEWKWNRTVLNAKQSNKVKNSAKNNQTIALTQI